MPDPTPPAVLRALLEELWADRTVFSIDRINVWAIGPEMTKSGNPRAGWVRIARTVWRKPADAAPEGTADTNRRQAARLAKIVRAGEAKLRRKGSRGPVVRAFVGPFLPTDRRGSYPTPLPLPL